MDVELEILDSRAIVPKYATKGSAGFDFHSLNNYTIAPNETVLIKTGLAMGIPTGYEIQVRPRSGLSLKTKLRICNSPGTIDSDYFMEIGIIIENTGNEYININEGDRIAQGVLCPVFQANFKVVNKLKETSRLGGFGSTGSGV